MYIARPMQVSLILLYAKDMHFKGSTSQIEDLAICKTTHGVQPGVRIREEFQPTQTD